MLGSEYCVVFLVTVTKYLKEATSGGDLFWLRIPVGIVYHVREGKAEQLLGNESVWQVPAISAEAGSRKH